ncbi:FliH/SctL family protein [Sphingomonas sp. 10B4]|uniref:FliH/SctL family protein n=1 Tax=Sphingomonas sp. 10B4 TaxID=3048575 RepID=UPI002AB3778E|nr:FliH/SctL family protein [Sphingomonas sp. 10B4]MDY7523934.1 FliH/SctL family protein [Sphingomonas sp. 10B4]MEB0282550.1 FliH/SctL family protein [Sphingomonas sp. 10B4]
MSEFTAGFSARGQGVAEALKAAFAPRVAGFAPADLRDRVARGPVSFAPQAAGEAGPRHFTPADPDTNPTEGWDPFEAAAAATSFVDPIEAAHSAGYAEGVAAAQAEMAVTGERDRTLLASLAQALKSDDRIDRDAVAQRLRQTVLFLVTRLVGEIGVEPDLLARRIEAAVDLLSDAAESAILHVHPDDVALLEGKLPRQIFAVGDASLARGSFQLESASTIVEDGPELWLEQLAHAIDRVAVPAA